MAEPDSGAKPGATAPSLSALTAALPEGDASAAPVPVSARADDVVGFRAAVVDAGSVSGGLWISYLGVLFYMLVAIGSVTHKELLLGSPIKLPFMNVDLPMTGFFWLGPILFLVVHAYVLLHFVMLARTIAALDQELIDTDFDRRTRANLRQQLPPNIFVQFLAGPPDVRDGTIGVFLWMIVIISLAIGPVLLFLFFVVQFIPYHDEFITWVQRILALLDIGLVWWFLSRIGSPPATERAKSRFSHNNLRLYTIAIMIVLSGGSLGVMAVATFTGETLERIVRWDVARQARAWLMEGAINLATLRQESLFSSTLVLPKFEGVDPAKQDRDGKISDVTATIAVYGRDLQGANLSLADLRNANFIHSKLNRAMLGSARLGHARLDHADLTDAKLDYADLTSANLSRAKLVGANLTGADLTLADLNNANLSNANLRDAKLAGANLSNANLMHANLAGANLTDANLTGAILTYAALSGVTLRGAILIGAALDLGWTTDASTLGSK